MTDKPAPAKRELSESRAAFKAATLATFKQRRTQIDYWSDTEYLASVAHIWRERAAAAAVLVAPGSRVLDLGCNDMQLEGLLPEGCSYLPLDVVSRDARTIVVDLNKDRLPPIEADVVVGLGILEYLFDVPRVLRQLARQIPRAVFCYHPLNQRPTLDRLAFGWVNALNVSEVTALMKYAGWRKVTVHRFRPGVIFLEASRVPPKGV